MGLFSKCMFSSVEGTILKDGSPVEGVEVTRSYRWINKEEKIETVVTDSKGRFSFKNWTSSSFLSSIIPVEPVIRQKIIFKYQDEEYTGWSFHKHSYADGDEVGVTPIVLQCDLDDEFKRQVPDGYFGICKLSSKPPEK